MKSHKYKTLLLGIIFCMAISVPAQAQTGGVKTVARAQSEKTPEVDEREQFRKEFIKATEEYKASLQNLAAAYEANLQKMSEQHGKLKELYNEGLIARRELEASDLTLAEARAKVDEVRKQLASVDTVLEAAIKGPEPSTAVSTPAPPVVAERRTPTWTTGSRPIDNLIIYNGTRFGVDPYLIYCVMHQESSFSARALSPKGAQGLMQLMPGTAARYGVVNPYDPAQSIMGGARYLKDLLRLFNGRVDLVLAGYNAGEGAVMKYGGRIPPYRETQDYVRRISARYAANPSIKPTAKTVPATRQRTRK